MKKYRAIIFIIILLIITGVMTMLHLKNREEIPEDAIKVSDGENTHIVDIHELTYKSVSGTLMNGKGEEIQVAAPGILLNDVLEGIGITQFDTVSVVADDSYSAEIFAEEIQNESKVYLIQEEGEERLCLTVFGDKDSKRNVRNVVQIIVNKDGDDAVAADSAAAAKVSFIDDLGREVTVEAPQRVAVLLGSFADMWVLAGGEVIASPDDAWVDFHLDMPAEAVNLGHTKELNMEKLFEAEPDFIIASAATRVDIEWKETLESTGIPTAYFDVSGFDDYLRVFKICTEITGQEELYDTYGSSIQTKINEVIEESKARVEEKGAPKVLFLRTSAMSIRAKNSEDSVLGEMLRELGCINIADSDTSLLENLSVEHILQEDPDFIFFAEVGDDPKAIEENINQFISDNPVWQELTAVKEGKVYTMEKELFNLKPNERWGEAYEKLEQILAEGQK